MAISAVDVALWDLKAKLLDVPLVDAARPRRATRCRSTAAAASPPTRGASSPSSSRGWVERRDPAREDEGRPRPGRRPDRVAAARRAIGDDAELFVDANGAYTAKQALRVAEQFAASASRWFEEPVSSDDLDGLRLLRDARRPGWNRRRRVRLRRSPTSALLAPAPSTASRPTPPAAAASPLLAAAALAEAYELDLSGHTRADAPRARALRPSRSCATSSTSTTTSASSACSSTASSSRATARSRPDRVRPGLGVELQARRRRALRRLMPPLGAARASTTAALDARPARPRSRARCASTPATARSTRPTARTTARCRSASSIPRTIDDVVATVAVCREHGAPDPVARRRHEPGRPVLQRRRRHRLLEVPEPRSLEIDPERRLARVAAGLVLDHLRDAAESARPDLRARPVDPQPLHARRDDRQQLLRRPLADGHSGRAATVRQRRRAGGPDLRRRADDASARRRRRARAIIARADAAARSTRPARRSRDRYGDQIRARYPEDPAPRLRLQPRRAAAGERLPRRARAGRHRGHLRHRPRGDAAPGRRARPRARSLVARLPRRLRRRPTTCRRCSSIEPIGLEGIDDVLVEDMTSKGMHRDDLALLPDGQRLAAGRVRRRRRRTEADDKARAADGRARERRPDPPAMKLFDDPARGAAALEGARGGPRRDRLRARQARHLGGLGGLGRAARAARRLPARAARAARRVRLRRRALRPLRPGLRAHPHRLRPRRRADGIAHVPRLPRRGGRPRASATAARSPASTATASRAAELLPKMFGARAGRGVPRVQGDLGSRRQDEPGQGRRPVPRSTENLRLGADYHPPRVETHFDFPDDDGSFAHATMRCVGVGKCRRDDGGAMCPSYMVTREEKHSTRGRAHLLFEMLHGERARAAGATTTVKEALDLCLGVQGLQERLPGQRRHGDLQGRVPLALLRAAAAARAPPTRSA